MLGRLPPAQAHTPLAAWLAVAPFPDAESAPRSIRARGMALAILSSGSPAMLVELMQTSGLAGYFGRLLSADAGQTYKPSPAYFCAIIPSTPTT